MRHINLISIISIFLVISCNKLNDDYVNGYNDGSGKSKKSGSNSMICYFGDDNYSKGWQDGFDNTRNNKIIQEYELKIKELEKQNQDLIKEAKLNKINRAILSNFEDNIYLIRLLKKTIKKYKANLP